MSPFTDAELEMLMSAVSGNVDWWRDALAVAKREHRDSSLEQQQHASWLRLLAKLEQEGDT